MPHHRAGCRSGLTGGALTAWNKVTLCAYVPGETLSNLVFGARLLAAFGSSASA